MEYTTDGMIVTHSEGGCMGIFSTVSLLNDKIAKIEELEKRLKDAEELIRLVSKPLTNQSVSKAREYLAKYSKEG